MSASKKLVEKVIEMTPEEAAKEMEKIVDKKEVEADKKDKEEKIKTLEKTERGYKRDDTRLNLDVWVPKTELGRLVKSGKIKDINEILDNNKKILEAEIVDSLLPIRIELLNIGQAKGKFGGGKRRGWRQTQKKTMEGNKLTFSVMAVAGDSNGHVGVGFGRASETFSAKDKAMKDARLNIFKVVRGCASYDCSCEEPHSIPFSTEGKCSSVVLKFKPAPQGAGLVVGDELKKIMRLAGIKDMYCKSFGKTGSTLNLAKAAVTALKKLNEFKSQ